MNELLAEKMIARITGYWQQISLENDPVELQGQYDLLRVDFAYLLFELNDRDSDDYAWLLLHQDAGLALDKLRLAYSWWQTSSKKKASWVAYQRSLTDFRWLIWLAISCVLH